MIPIGYGRRGRAGAAMAGVLLLAGCRTSDLLRVPTPAGVVPPGALTGGAGGDALRYGATTAFGQAFGAPDFGERADQVASTGAFTDEFTVTVNELLAIVAMDARNIALPGAASVFGGVGALATDPAYAKLQKARLAALLAAQTLLATPGGTGQAKGAEMYALAGYAELLLAEDFCSGVPLGSVTRGAGGSYGSQLTTDSLLGHAVAQFDSALVLAGDSVRYLAAIGRARALVDRGQYAAAAAAVQSVPTAFTYVAVQTANGYAPTDNVYYDLITLGSNVYRFLSVGNNKGANGLAYVSAGDPRMPIDSTMGPTPIGTPFYYPLKFPIGGPPAIPLATGAEARLIEAEAALQANDVAGWAHDLNALRMNAPATYLMLANPMDTLSADSTTLASPSMQVDVLFRERAFWLFGTGHRLSDLRRLVRQYGRDQGTVYSVGAYPLSGQLAGAPATYGTDVVWSVAGAEQANPNFHGCLSKGA